jgi:hypothetical protein
MITSKKTWKEKRIEKEGKDSDGSKDDAVVGEPGLEVDINMVFQIPAEFALPVAEVAQLNLGAERAVFQKPGKLGQHMKPLYVKGFLDGEPINRVLVDGGACVNIYAKHHV